MIQKLSEIFSDENLLTFTGYDNAILGYHHDSGKVVYSLEKLIKIIYEKNIVRDKSFTRSDAFDHFAYNMEDAHLGPHTPMVIYDIKDEE